MSDIDLAIKVCKDAQKQLEVNVERRKKLEVELSMMTTQKQQLSDKITEVWGYEFICESSLF